MRWLLETRPCRPWAGLLFAVGLLVGDAVLVARPTFGWFEDASLWPRAPLAAAFGSYLAFGVIGDLLAQACWPAARRSPIPRLLALCAVGAVLALQANESRSLPLFAAGAGFALVALGRFTWPLAAAGAVVALWPALAQPTRPAAPELADPPRADAPSFVVVVLDTLRLDRTSAYGHPRDTTPNLRRLAARGVRFDRAHGTGSWSLPNHASLFTGLGTAHHGAHNEHPFLDERHATLASALAAHGFETFSSSGNPWLGHGTGMARGFHHVHEPWRTVHMKWFLLAFRLYSGLLAPDRDKGGADTLRAVREWLETRDPDRPYLLFVNFMEAHGPYQDVPRESRRRFTNPDLSLRDLEAVGMRGWEASQNGEPLPEALRDDVLDLYDGAIAAADAYLGELLALVGDEPVIVVIADHGEYAGEKTLYGHPSVLYEGGLHVPLVMAGRPLPAGVRVDALVSTEDVMPTLLAIAGIAPPPGIDGIDLRPVVAGSARPERTLYAEAYPDADDSWAKSRPALADALLARKRAAVQGSGKRIVGEDGTDLTFDLAADPREEAPLAPGSTALAVSPPTPPTGGGAGRLDEGQRRALQALGYVEEDASP